VKNSTCKFSNPAMMKILKKILLGICSIIICLIIFIFIAGNKKFDAPLPNIHASNDPDIIARGKYLVFGPAHCAPCHVPMDKMLEVDEGLEMPLIGGMLLEIPPATLRAPNLTPDIETGIGNISDGAIARSIRYGVKHDGGYMMPVMSYAEMSDADIQAIISYLRSQPPVRNEVKPSQYKFLGKALLAFGILKPLKHSRQLPQKVKKIVSIEYGEYLASGVANCLGCHTELDILSGQFTKPLYSGGFHFEPDEFTEGKSFVSPNITPHPKTGIMAHWTVENFIDRFRSGRIHKGSPMPWGSYTRMDSTDLISIFKFLQSLEPIENKVKKTVYLLGETSN
jgi:mono/diheme cytochrome c family protein